MIHVIGIVHMVDDVEYDDQCTSFWYVNGMASSA